MLETSGELRIGRKRTRQGQKPGETEERKDSRKCTYELWSAFNIRAGWMAIGIK
jgi:hypothetical protein